jgi:hypothetical protein
MEKWLVLMKISAWMFGKIWLIFAHIPPHSQGQHDPHGPDDPFRTINYHHLDISRQDGMDEQDIGWRNGWC